MTDADAVSTGRHAAAEPTTDPVDVVEAEVVEESTDPAATGSPDATDTPNATDVTDPAADGDDAVSEADDADGAEADVDAEEAADPADPTAQLQSELDERTSDLQRVSAEYANFRRRTEREREAVVLAAKGKVLTELLPLLDDLERARQHGDLESGPMKVMADKLEAVVAAQGAEAFGAEGEEFSADSHEAVQDLGGDGDTPVIDTVLRRGYRLGDRVLRTAMVIVRS